MTNGDWRFTTDPNQRSPIGARLVAAIRLTARTASEMGCDAEGWSARFGVCVDRYPAAGRGKSSPGRRQERVTREASRLSPGYYGQMRRVGWFFLICAALGAQVDP